MEPKYDQRSGANETRDGLAQRCLRLAIFCLHPSASARANLPGQICLAVINTGLQAGAEQHHHARSCFNSFHLSPRACKALKRLVPILVHTPA